MSKKIMMFGSFVVDVMARGPHLPVPGETVKSGFFKLGAGGKGFNQGIAASKSGGDVVLITKLGRDSFSQIAVDAMNDIGLDTSNLLWNDEFATGIALIEVDENTGQNAIMVVPSACDHITDEEVDSVSDIMDGVDIVLTQLETNMSSIERLIDMAYSKGKTIVLNTAPVQPVRDELLSKCTIVTPNEVEAGILTGTEVTDMESASKAARFFFDRGVKIVVITMGSKGAYVSDGKTEKMVPPFKVNALDTTGAGDAFNGGFVTALAEGKDIFEASRFGSAVAAISVTRMGTTPSMPTRQEVDEFLAANP